MADAVVSALLQPVFERAINAAADEFKLIRNVREEVEKLSGPLSMIKAVLQDAEEKQSVDEGVRLWLGRLKQILYDVDDILDEYATDTALQSRRGEDVAAQINYWKDKVSQVICCSSRLNNIKSSSLMAHRVREIRQRLDVVARERQDFNLQVNGGSRRLETMRRQPQTSSVLPDESFVIGRDDDKKKIISLLLASSDEPESSNKSRNKNISVLPIVGMGGLGKTTLAQYVFNDEKVKGYFQLRMWVCVSDEFNLQRITKEIIDAALSSENKSAIRDSTNWDATHKGLQEIIKGTKFLLVLDDVWEEDQSRWESLTVPLRAGGKGSKILITTRSKKVAGIVKEGMKPIILCGLSTEVLLSLFKRIAFRDSDPSEYTQFEVISAQIVERLKGSPLAAKTLGVLLNTNLDLKYWRNMMKSKLWELQQGDNGILPALRISYQHLPSHLKQCFTFCCLFYKDYQFDKDELVKLWIAQCFVENRKDILMEDIGREYFDELSFRSFFECPDRFLVNFVMHDLIHDLAESTSNDEYLKISENMSQKAPVTVRHISVVSSRVDNDVLKKLFNYKSLRTILFMRGSTFDLDLVHLFTKLRKVRILGLKSCNVKVLPNSIGDLKLLRFLDLSDNPIDELPESLSDLYNLQVLKVEGCSKLGSLPIGIKELINLRHLEGDEKLISDFNGIGKLISLQELKIGGDKIRELRNMNMLRELRIRNLENVPNTDAVLEAMLTSKTHLDMLKLSWGGNRDVNSINPQLEVEVLEGLKPHTDLKGLVIKCYGGVRSPRWMDEGSLDCLESIRLEGWKSWERWGGFSDGNLSSFLPCLQKLYIEKCPKLRELPPLPVALKDLTIYGCEELELLRSSGRLPSLKSLKINECPKLMWGSSSSSTSSSDNLLPSSLVRVEIHHVGDMMDRCLSMSLQNFTSLEHLSIENCPQTTKTLLLLLLLQQQQQQRRRQPSLSLAATLTELEIKSVSKEDLLICMSSTATTPPVELLLLLQQQQQAPHHHPSQVEGVDFRSLTSLTDLTIPATLLEPLSSPEAGGGLPSSLLNLVICGDGGDEEEEQHPLLEDDTSSLSTCLRGLTSLKRLFIIKCPTITSLPGEDVFCHLTALDELYVSDCREITSLGSLNALASLDTLHISGCPKLRHLVSPLHTSPTLLSPLRELTIQQSSPRQIKGWLLQRGSSSSNFPSLQDLWIWECPELRSLGGGGDDDDDEDVGRELEEALLLSLAPSLTSLWIQDCKNLRSLPARLSCFTSLETLRIYQCPQIQSLPEMGLPSSLQSLHIRGCPQIQSLPEMGLPSSLQSLTIWGCPQIQSLPEMGLPSSLRSLTISGCPALVESCREDGGPDWPKISHIPRKRIY